MELTGKRKRRNPNNICGPFGIGGLLFRTPKDPVSYRPKAANSLRHCAATTDRRHPADNSLTNEL